MLVKHLNHGTGDAQKAVDYLEGDLDHTGNVRAEVKMLAGDPSIFAVVANNLSFKNKYTSGVIAYHADDKPTDEEINQDVAQYFELALGGLSQDRVPVVAYLHRDADGSCHVHTLIAHVDLETGKHFNPTPPGWEKDFAHYKNHANFSRGYADPDAPEHQRTLSRGIGHIIDAANFRRGLPAVEDPKIALNAIIENHIEHGLIKNRADIVKTFKEMGFEVTRQSDKFVSVRDPETDTKLRMKGRIYEQGFDADRALEEQPRADAKNARNPDPERASAAWEGLRSAIEKRTEYNQKRYASKPSRAVAVNERDRVADEKAHDLVRENVLDYVHDSSRTVFDIESDSHLLDTGTEVFSAEPAAGQEPVSAAAAEPVPSVQPIVQEIVKQSVKNKSDTSDQKSDDTSDSKSEDTTPEKQVYTLPDFTTALQPEPSMTGGKKSHDRDREIVARIVEQIERRLDAARAALTQTVDNIRRRIEALAGANDGLELAGSTVSNSSRSLNASSVGLKSAGTVMTKNRDDELENIKQNVNLVEYAQSRGYEISKRDSSKNSTAMKRGGDKIIVATGQDGHGIFFSVNDNFSGSVVDFVQKLDGANLGQVRKELRPWAGLSKQPPVNRLEPEQRPPKPAKSDADGLALAKSLASLKDDVNPHYLTEKRKIDFDTVSDFASVLRSDSTGKTCFMHRALDGSVTGFERKAEGHTGFASGGKKNLFIHSPTGGKLDETRQNRLILCESAIDAMSYAELHGKPGDVFASIGGSMSPQQREMLQTLMARSKTTIAAFDADEQGEAFTREVQALGSPVERHKPGLGKDWNEHLQIMKADALKMDEMHKRMQSINERAPEKVIDPAALERLTARFAAQEAKDAQAQQQKPSKGMSL